MEVPEQPSLFLLSGGRPVPNPLEILASQKFEAVLASIRKAFEFVVVDCCPVLPVSDAIVMGRQVDVVVMVVQAEKTPDEMAIDSLKRLQAAQLRPIGVVLQQANLKRAQSYAYDYGGYYQYGGTGKS